MGKARYRTDMNRHLQTSSSSGLFADVRLGSPRFADCRGVGICAILLHADAPPRPVCRDWCRAWLEVDRATERLLLAFDRDTITERTFDHHFASGLLKVQQAYRLPDAVADRLRLTAGCREVRTGAYPILEMPDFLLVSCRLTGGQVRALPGLQWAA